MSEHSPQTVADIIVPLLERNARTILERKRVSPEKFAFWLYAQSYGRRPAIPLILICLLLSVCAALISIWMMRSGLGDEEARHLFLVLFSSIVGVGAIAGLVWWSRTYTVYALVKEMATLQFLPRTTSASLATISERTWEKIRSWIPDEKLFALDRSVFRRSLPELSSQQLDRMAAYQPWKTRLGWVTLVLALLIFFVPDTLFDFLIGLFLLSLGFYFLLGSCQMWIAQCIQIRRSGSGPHAIPRSVMIGPPARLIAGIYMALSTILILAGSFGMLRL